MHVFASYDMHVSSSSYDMHVSSSSYDMHVCEQMQKALPSCPSAVVYYSSISSRHVSSSSYGMHMSSSYGMHVSFSFGMHVSSSSQLGASHVDLIGRSLAQSRAAHPDREATYDQARGATATVFSFFHFFMSTLLSSVWPSSRSIGNGMLHRKLFFR
jgi:hypothetical protein